MTSACTILSRLAPGELLRGQIGQSYSCDVDLVVRPADTTGRVFSSLDLIDEWGLNSAHSTEWPACDSER